MKGYTDMSSKKWFALISLVASIIAIIVFVTDKNMPDILELITQENNFTKEPDVPVRLKFEPIINNGLPPDMEISRIFSTSDQKKLFMLNAVTGSIFRASRTLSGYDYNVDFAFICGPGQYDNILVGKIVDFVVISESTALDDAKVLGVDAIGNLLYCFDSSSPVAASLIPPASNWGEISKIHYSNGKLFVLDIVTSSIWVYPQNSYNRFDDMPDFFFDNQVPHLAKTVDIAPSYVGVYLLQNDGKIQLCSTNFTSDGLITCEFLEYIDPREGKTYDVNSILFSQFAITYPPAEYLALLEPYTHSVYIFNVDTLELLYIVEQDNLFLAPEQIVAFTISHPGVIFFATGNQIYSALLP